MNAKLFFKRNASTILTCVGGIGVVATAVVAVKDTPKAMQIIEKAKEEGGKEKFRSMGVHLRRTYLSLSDFPYRRLQPRNESVGLDGKMLRHRRVSVLGDDQLAFQKRGL